MKKTLMVVGLLVGAVGAQRWWVRSCNAQEKARIDKIEHARLEKLFQEVYQSNKVQDLSLANLEKGTLRIPRKIHQIWIGPRPVPEKFKWMIETWAQLHPGWEYKLWTNKDLETFPLVNKEAFDCATNWGMKADILRYEILYNYGGVYADVDFECIKSFEPLNYAYDFYAGLLSPHEIANGLIASAPGSPILAAAIEGIKNKAQQLKECGSTDSMAIICATGPIFFTNVVAQYYQEQDEASRQHMIVLPKDYFYAFPSTESYWTGKVTRERVLSYVKPETFSLHYWAMSWNDGTTA